MTAPSATVTLKLPIGLPRTGSFTETGVEQEHAARAGIALSRRHCPQRTLHTRLGQRARLGARHLVAGALRLARGEDGEGDHEGRQDHHDDHRHRKRDTTLVLDGLGSFHSFLNLTRPWTTTRGLLGKEVSSGCVVSWMSTE